MDCRSALNLSCEYVNISSVTLEEQPTVKAEEIARQALALYPVPEFPLDTMATYSSDEAIKELFHKISYFKLHVEQRQIADRNWSYNRYSDVVPHDYCYLTVKDGAINTYVNASPAVLMGRCYIMTQSPLPHTIPYFTQMLKEQEVDTIVTLSMPEEKGQVKGLDYWSALQEGGDKIIMQEEEQVLVERQLRGGVRQIHYQRWPDQGVPKISLFKKLLESAKTDKPLVVHCSAGIGRTGTFVLADALTRYGASPEMPLVKTFAEMRTQRAGTIQTWQQLKTVVSLFTSGFRSGPG